MNGLFKFSIVVIVLAVLIYYWKIYEYSEDVFVDTYYGRLKGFTSFSRGGRQFSQFRGIKYAKAPVGNLRFQPPVEYGKWQGTFDATRSIPICPQIDFMWKRNIGQDDCLILNVYTPKVSFTNNDNKDKLPVLIFIHGGHYMYGSSDIFGPHYFMDEDVLIVTLNYRVGSLGFLNSGDDVVSGNMGLKDQIAALKWIKKGISAFGGDPEAITIFGESAGAASVHYLTLYTKESLFQRSISQSGVTLCPWALLDNAKEQAIRLGKKLNCPTGNSEKMIECLRGKSSYEIVETQREILNIFNGPEVIYLPSIETVTDKNKHHVLITEAPEQVLKNGNYRKVDWIVGVTSEEGSIRAPLIIMDDERLAKFNSDFSNLSSNLFILNNPKPFVAENIWKYYFGSKKSITEDDLFTLINLYSDRFFFKPTHDAIIHTTNHNVTTYAYYLNYQTGKGLAHAMVASRGKYPVFIEFLILFFKFLSNSQESYGVGHADDIQHFFKTIPLWNIDIDSEHYPISESLIKAWVSFAKSGKPSKILGQEWEKVSSKKDEPIKYLKIAKQPEMIPAPFVDRIAFWEALLLNMKK